MFLYLKYFSICFLRIRALSYITTELWKLRNVWSTKYCYVTVQLGSLVHLVVMPFKLPLIWNIFSVLKDWIWGCFQTFLNLDLPDISKRLIQVMPFWQRVCTTGGMLCPSQVHMRYFTEWGHMCICFVIDDVVFDHLDKVVSAKFLHWKFSFFPL